MSFIETNNLKNSTIMLLFSERDEIQTSPDYQRMGGIWTLEKRRLLIDSILNDYDIPKIYFHEFSRRKFDESGYKYAIIDGRQRLETLWSFMKDEFSLNQDIMYQKDPEINLAGMRYSDIANEFPKLRIKFDSFVLPVVSVRTEDDDIDLIEDMFSRLNEAVPLNAAEKRNAIGGDFIRAVNRLASHELFVSKVKFLNKRYQHREVAARFLLTELNISQHDRVIDTKKAYLDQLAHDLKDDIDSIIRPIESEVKLTLDSMISVFHSSDELLQAQGNMVVYYLLFRKARKSEELALVTRAKLLQFREALRENRRIAEEDYPQSKFELLEFDRLSQQGTNDASSIMTRYQILAEFLQLSNPERQEKKISAF